MSSNSSRIAQNTIILYGRSLIMMVIAIYSSRVLLSTLGVANYGIYNVVGGVVTLFSSIKSVLASSVQRFLNFYKGKGDALGVSSIFNTSLIIHILLAAGFLVIIEIFGLWFIPNKLVLPENSLGNAMFVFHTSVVSTIVTIIIIPYDAVVIANERMDFYAYSTIAEATLKLGIIFLLPLLHIEYLKSYSILILLVTIIIRIITISYCHRFDECKFVKNFNMNIFKDMSSFAGWNFLGCTASSLIEEGSNFVLNTFGGVVANAARGIAYQIKSAITLLSGNIVVASQPFIMQQAATVDKQKFYSYIFMQSRMIFYIVSLTVLPLFVYCDNILSIWLKQVPTYASEFTKAILIYMVVMSFQKSLDIAFKSYGNISKYQIIDTCVSVLTLPIAYIILKIGAPLHYAFYIFSLVRVIDYVAVIILANKQIELPIKRYLKEVVLTSCMATVMIVAIGFIFSKFCKCPKNLIILLLEISAIMLIAGAAYYFLIFTKEEKGLIRQLLKKHSGK